MRCDRIVMTSEQIHQPNSNKALADIRVLDLSQEIGAYCTKIMADLGANVIRIEPPEGDSLRHKGPYYHGQVDIEKSLRHFQYNTSKRSITLDIEKPEGAALLRHLASRCDVLVDGYPPGHLAGLGLGHDELSKANLRLITASITPFGQRGEYSSYAGTDIVGTAMGGLMALCGFPDDPPNHPAGQQGYHLASIAASAGITLAVCARDLDPNGRGRRLEVSMQEAVSVSTLQTANAIFYTDLDTTPNRVGLGSAGGLGRTILQCKDGRWVSFIVPPDFWDNFVVWLVENDLAGVLIAPEWADPARRIEDSSPITEATAKLAALYDRNDFFLEAQKRRLLGMPVNTIDDLIVDEQLNSRGFFVDVEHEDLQETLTYPGAPVVFSETPYEIAHAAPHLGQHNEEVYTHELDLTDDELVDLRSRGVI